VYSIDCSVFIAGLPQWAMLRQRGQGADMQLGLTLGLEPKAEVWMAEVS
jgi:hypothetical protein